MSLKHKYAAFMLLVLAVLSGYCWIALALLKKQLFLLLIMLAVMIYLTTYLVGRKCSQVFFVLSSIKYLKNNNGQVSKAGFRTFISGSIRKRQSTEDTNRYAEQILKILEDENIVRVTGETIMLTEL